MHRTHQYTPQELIAHVQALVDSGNLCDFHDENLEELIGLVTKRQALLIELVDALTPEAWEVLPEYLQNKLLKASQEEVFLIMSIVSSWKAERREFCHKRNLEHKERERQYHKDLREGAFKDLPGTQVFKQCKNCKGGMVAKKVDIKRGWGRFCSKSCKAQF